MTQKTPSRQLKSALNKAFPGTKFRVVTYRSSDAVAVDWILELGSPVTVSAVREISSKFETLKVHGDIINDSHWYTGYRIQLEPNITEERKQWSAEQINFVGTAWDDTLKIFVDNRGIRHYGAQQQYENFCKNGVACNLLTENGGEPFDKIWFYKKNLKKETQV